MSKIDILSRGSVLATIAVIFSSCAAHDTQHRVVISTREQKLALLDRGNLAA